MDIKLSNVKQKNKFVEMLPWIGRGVSTAIYPNVYLSRKVYKEIHADNPDPKYVSVLVHEQEHINRAKDYGALKWNIKYLLSRQFRFEEELAATQPQIHYLKSENMTYDFESKARSLSGWLYFWCVSYDKALRELKNL